MLKRDSPWILAVAICSLSTLLLGAPRGRTTEPQVFSTPRGEAQNVRFELVAGAIVHIDYDLVSTDPRAVFSVTLEASQDGGTTFGMRPQSVSGDVGPGITPGTGKRIAWDSGKDVERMQIDQFRFRIVATAGPLEPQPAVVNRMTTGGLTIRTDPAGAQVILDGTPRGVTPLELHDLPAGVHRVTVAKTGFLENSRLVIVQPAGNEIVTVALTARVTQPVAATTSGQSGGGSRAKWLIPLAAGGGLAAVLGARSGGSASSTSPPASPASTTTAPAASCIYVVSTSSFTLAADDRSAQSVNVSTSAACSWTATSTATFIKINGGGTFLGSGTATFVVDPNTSGSDRIGTLTVAERTVTVTQVASGPDTVGFVSLAPPNGSTLVAGPNSSGVSATLRYSLRSRDRAFVCVNPYFSLFSGPLTGNCGPQQITRGSGTVTVRFSVTASEPNLPVTTSLLGVFMGDAPTFGSTTFFTGFEPASFTWIRP